MALHHNPRIITSGLVLALDAGDVNSYPGSGTTWYDLSGNGNHVTLYNGPTFADGTLTGNGTNEYGRTNNTLNLTGLSAITVISTWKQTSTTAGGMVYEHTSTWNTNNDYEGVSYGGFGLYTNSNGTGTVANMNHHQLRGNVGYGGSNTTSPNTATFQHYTTIHNFAAAGASETLVYINGAFADDSYGTTDNTSTFGDDYLYLWSRGGSSAWSTNSLGFLQIYNRILSAKEILQNYNATRTRFGL